MRFYYIDTENKTIKHFQDKQNPIEGFEFVGGSDMKVIAACGFYANNKEGFSIIDGDLPDSTEIVSPTLTT